LSPYLLANCLCLIARKKVKTAPPRFRQNINVMIGIALNAINGPEVPIPITPTLNRIKSARFGSDNC
jgi:hypothetical protein